MNTLTSKRYIPIQMALSNSVTDNSVKHNISISVPLPHCQPPLLYEIFYVIPCSISRDN